MVLNDNIKILGYRDHNKASEKYVDCIIKDPESRTWKVSVPYYYRRTGLFLEKEELIVDYLNTIYQYFNDKYITKWVKEQNIYWNENFKNKEVTREFFNKLTNFKWNSVKTDLPPNPNWARRVQDIKEMGYTLSTSTIDNITHIMLLPIPRQGITGYEIISPALRKKIISALKYYQAFEAKRVASSSLLPDHKFSEIRWDDNTREEDIKDMTNEEIVKKFQLLDNQRNQQKREICRKCFQTGKRGTIYGIKFYYQGGENWDNSIPKTGKRAERGCIGCPWYDIESWRHELQKFIEKFD